ncbi:hypothetical protein FHS59_002445 [Algoriphagus iocasae]|uniref:Outer membrane protein beta-barrel domain-containing protein n=1 Tax=Algoriphagus iocasae TaxID=1836499 RepID=A0A841MMS8_9BACT|nr:hypothetical protein [Algoriphagus iocasae]MBB6326817.1 hypothetical protein [Algoriphagus iocasae]
MKKIQLLFLALLFSFCAKAQTSDSKFYFGFDASYWQRANYNTDPLAVQRDMLGSIRPMIGINLKKNWSLGIITNFSSYQDQVSPVEISYPIYGELDENDNYPVIGYRNTSQEASFKNSLVGYGVFLKKFINLGKKTSINLSLYGMKESRNEGNLLISPDFGSYYPCVNCYYPTSSNFYCPTCLSIAYSRIEIPFEETNWRAGLDIAFAYQLKPWLGLEVRANILEYRKQILKDKRVQYETIDFAYDPFLGAISQYFGNHYDLGSAVARDGVRFGLIFSPF